MKIELNSELIDRVGTIADKHGVTVYAVGGCVRDFFLGKERKDFDFTVVGNPLSFADAVADELGTHAVLYERFRTALVPAGEFN